jgi:hypothetical protein
MERIYIGSILGRMMNKNTCGGGTSTNYDHILFGLVPAILSVIPMELT